MLDSMDIERERGITIKAQTAALELHGARRRSLPAQPDRHARATSTSPTKSAGRSRPAKARCSSSTRARASRRRPSPTATPRSSTASRSCRCSTRWTCRRPTPSAPAPRSRTSSASMPTTRCPCSAKTGEGHRRDPRGGRAPHAGAARTTRRAAARMIIDSWFDNYVGVVMLVRVVDGPLQRGERIRLMASDAVYGADQLGVFTPSSVAARRALGRRGRLPDRRHQGAPGGQGRRHDHAREEAAEQRRRRRPRRCPASRRSSRRSSPASIRPRRASTTSCATRSRSSS